MKKIVVIACLSVLMFSCKTKTVVSNDGTVVPAKVEAPKELDISNIVDVSYQSGLKGDWVIASVSYPGSDFIKVNSFDIADSQCFIGSTWKFYPSNNQGNMTIKSTNCSEFNSPVNWFVNKEGKFILKVVWAGEKAKKVRTGYVLTLANKTDNAFQLIDKLSIGNKPTDIVYQFQRVTK